MSWKNNFPKGWHPVLTKLIGARLAFFNFISLGLLKTTDALILLFLIPIIISRVGIDNFGIIAFVQVGLNYGRTFVDYGFNITGVRQIALAQKEKRSFSELFFQVLYCKAFIAILFTIGLCLLIYGIPFLQNKASAFYWGLWLVVGQIFFADWFFIGLQKSHLLTIANLIIKCVFALFIWFGIHEEADYIYVLAFQGGAAAMIGILVTLYIVWRFKLGFQWPKIRVIKAYLQNDFRLLGTNLAIEVNSSYSLLVLNVLLGDAITGYFNVMYRLVQPLRFLLIIFSQTIFPIICEKTKEGWLVLSTFLQNAFLLFVAFPLIGVLGLMFFAEPIFLYFAGTVNPDLLYSLRLYLIVPLIILANIPAYQILLAYELKSAYASIYLIGVLFNLITAYVLTRFFGLNGLIVSIILVETLTCVGLYIMVKKHFKQITKPVEVL